MGQPPTRDLKWSNGPHCNPVFLPRLFPECTLVTAARRLPLQSADNRTFDTCERDKRAQGWYTDIKRALKNWQPAASLPYYSKKLENAAVYIALRKALTHSLDRLTGGRSYSALPLHYSMSRQLVDASSAAIQPLNPCMPPTATSVVRLAARSFVYG